MVTAGSSVQFGLTAARARFMKRSSSSPLSARRSAAGVEATAIGAPAGPDKAEQRAVVLSSQPQQP
jgi:hypothetical protein